MNDQDSFILASLNPEQKEAVTFLDGPCLVLAGAGSGKSRVVTRRMAWLIDQGISPYEIIGVTFTNKAAIEMKERVEKLVSHAPFVATFHKLGSRILRESFQVMGRDPHFLVFDRDDQLKLIKQALNEVGIKEEAKAVHEAISSLKNAGILPDAKAMEKERRFQGRLGKIYSLYQKKLIEHGAVDFDDLLLLPLVLFDTHPEVLESYRARWKYFLIDEYQDTNPTQHRLIQLLAGPLSHVFAVGDPDQSIYSWRGADVDIIMGFEEEFKGARVIRLEQNYRSTNCILKAATRVIGQNRNRFDKKLWSALGEGEKIFFHTAANSEKEAEFVAKYLRFFHEDKGIPYSDMAVLYRTNAQSRSFEETFPFQKVPYAVYGGYSFYERKEIKDILSYLRFAVAPHDALAFARAISVPKRGIGETTLLRMQEKAVEMELPLFNALEKMLEDPSIIRLSKKQKDSLSQFIKALYEIKTAPDVVDAIQAALRKTGYYEYLYEDLETFDERLENIESLAAKAFSWTETKEEPSLLHFLEDIFLVTSEEDFSAEKVSLMTLHNAKGLEFRVVFITGLEEGLLPHTRSVSFDSALEEERRLFYVGMTRAKERLLISRALFRFSWGNEGYTLPSRFLREIPEESRRLI